MSVNVACQRVTGSHLGHPFLHRMAGVQESPKKSNKVLRSGDSGESGRVEQSRTK
jgi:hypothetical protein